MWPFLNNVITTCPDSYCTPASSICYTGSNLSCIGVNKNDTLAVALQKINALMCEPITLQKVVNAGNTIVLPSNVNRGIDITVLDLQNQYSNGIRVTVTPQTGTYSNNDAFVAIINGQNPGSLPNFVGGFYAIATGADNFSFVSEHINGTVSSSHYIAINVLGITSNFASFSTNNIEVYNVDYLGNTTANSFVKTGGTSNQFLKADGSIDNTIYAENANVLHKTGSETKNGSLYVSDTGDGVGIRGYSNIAVGVYGQSTSGNAVKGESSTNNGVYGSSTNSNGVYGSSSDGNGVYGYSSNSLAGLFNINSGTKIVSFRVNGTEQSYILATGLFKANKILVNTTTDNGIDALQVNGTINATAASTANQVVIKSQLDTVRPYKVYTALLTQIGTNAPVATVLENTLGGTIVWSYSGTGSYVAILTGAFVLNKTWCSITNSGSANTTVTSSRSSNDTVNVNSLFSGNLTNSIMSPASLEIRVYN